MCIGFRVGLDESQHPRLRFPGQPGVAQRAQALVTPHLPQRLSATEGVDWLALKAAGAEIAKGTGTVSLRQGNCARSAAALLALTCCNARHHHQQHIKSTETTSSTLRDN